MSWILESEIEDLKEEINKHKTALEKILQLSTTNDKLADAQYIAMLALDKDDI